MDEIFILRKFKQKSQKIRENKNEIKLTKLKAQIEIVKLRHTPSMIPMHVWLHLTSQTYIGIYRIYENRTPNI